jgi:hypothetical protein
MARQTRAAKLLERLIEQRRFIYDHGGTREGYIATYGSAFAPDHYGDGGELIYDADLNAMLTLQREYAIAVKRSRR